MARLTKRLVGSLRIKQSDSLYWDGEVSGFGPRIKPSGRKSFCIQYRTAKGRTSKRLTIGPCGTYTVEKARERARHLLQAVREGRDPPMSERPKRARQRSPNWQGGTWRSTPGRRRSHRASRRTRVGRLCSCTVCGPALAFSMVRAPPLAVVFVRLR